MADINIDPRTVRQAAADLRLCIEEMEAKISTFADIENEIEGAWKSRYTRQYIRCLEDTEGEVRRTVQSLKTVSSNLDGIAGAVEKAEDELQKLMSGSGGGGGTAW